MMINFYEAQKSAILLFIGFVISLSLGERVKSVVMQINTLKTTIFSCKYRSYFSSHGL